MSLSKALFALTLAAGVSAAAYAQAYPVKPVRMVLPFPAGTGADAVTRVVSEKLAQVWSQPVVVDNRPGAGGTLGVALVSRAQADGYVLLAHTSTYSVSAAVYSKLPYDPGRDFHALGAIGTQPYLLVTASNAAWKQVSELIAAAKARPGRMDYGSAGVGSSTHLVVEKFRRAAGLKAEHVPYRSIVEAMSDTIAGRIGYWFPPLGGALALVRDGRLAALGVTGHKRSGFLPQVRTLAESGLPGLDDANWFGVWAPAGTPTSVTDRVARDVANAVAAPDVQGRLEATGTEPLSMKAADFARFVRAEMERAASIVEAAGIPRQ